MFVRWKRRKRTGGSKTSRRRAEQWGDSLAAYLVESNRASGRVRQRVLCYIGCIDEKLLSSRIFFWKRAEAHLDTLQISEQARAEIRTKLREMVAPGLKAWLPSVRTAFMPSHGLAWWLKVKNINRPGRNAKAN